MGLIRGCLMLVGLATLAMLTSCVLGVAGMRRMADPTHFTRTVDEDVDKTRRMVRGYLDTAENEASDQRGLPQPTTLAVQDYTDGSVHLTLDGRAGRLMEVAATFRPDGEGATVVEVFSDAGPLAEAVRPRMEAAALHREIRQDIGGALTAISAHEVVPGGFLISRFLADARGEGRYWRRHR